MKKIQALSIIFGVIFVFSAIVNISIVNARLDSNRGLFDIVFKNRIDITFEKENLKASKISGKIHIDNNWSAAIAEGICSGTGTYSDPYVIEDLIIDGGGSGSCIRIDAFWTGEYFKIENCTLYNSGDWSYFGGYHDAGILLNGVYGGISRGILIDNIISNNFRGIELVNCRNITISSNTIYNNTFGMFLGFSSDENTISSNTIYKNDYGIFLDVFCESNKISANSVNSNNIGGVFLEQDANNNELLGNIITNNLFYGIGLDASTYDNNIYHNCFINTYNAFDGSLNNNWDNGTIGNYWEDYTGIDADNNGIGDTPYNISQSISFFVPGNQDHFPLMGCPFSSVQRNNIIPGYNLFVLFGFFSVVSYILYKKMEK